MAADLLQLIEPKKPDLVGKVYPCYEDLTFRSPVNSEAQAIELLTCVQAIVSAVGTDNIIQLTRAIEKKPQLLQQAMTYLPLILGK